MHTNLHSKDHLPNWKGQSICQLENDTATVLTGELSLFVSTPVCWQTIRLGLMAPEVRDLTLPYHNA